MNNGCAVQLRDWIDGENKAHRCRTARRGEELAECERGLEVVEWLPFWQGEVGYFTCLS